MERLIKVNKNSIKQESHASTLFRFFNLLRTNSPHQFIILLMIISMSFLCSSFVIKPVDSSSQLHHKNVAGMINNNVVNANTVDNNHKQHTISKWAIGRKSIVFDLKTPKVFYCPQSKQADDNKMIVKSVQLEKLCEFGGDPKPKGNPSDCYNDLDETEFACDEKKRFMVSSCNYYYLIITS